MICGVRLQLPITQFLRIVDSLFLFQHARMGKDIDHHRNNDRLPMRMQTATAAPGERA